MAGTVKVKNESKERKVLLSGTYKDTTVDLTNVTPPSQPPPSMGYKHDPTGGYIKLAEPEVEVVAEVSGPPAGWKEHPEGGYVRA